MACFRPRVMTGTLAATVAIRKAEVFILCSPLQGGLATEAAYGQRQVVPEPLTNDQVLDLRG
jgi:hypothetical protein